MRDAIHNSRRLLPLFLATTVLPVVCLAWLAWRVVVESRQAQQARAIEQREQAADLAASALQRVIAEANARLANFSAAAPPPSTAPDGVALVSLPHATPPRRAGTPLPFYPAFYTENAKPLHTTLARFATADLLELQKNDSTAALKAVAPLTKSANPMFRGEALLRMARIERKLGDSGKSIDAFRTLDALDDVNVEGDPAGLVARQGRALLFEAAGRRDDLAREAAGLCQDLANGRWLLSREQFDISFSQAQSWMAADAAAQCEVAAERLAMADALDSAWREWQALGVRAPSGAHAVQADGTSVLLLSRSTPERETVLLMAPSFLQSAWLATLRTSARGQGFDFALLDSDGRAVLGNINTPLSMQSVRAAGATRLPWTIHVISRTEDVPRALSGQTKLVLSGIAIMAALALSGGWLVNRALLRELRVARVQSDFVAAVSHEFRTPLTTIRQLAEMLANGRVSNNDRRQQFYGLLLCESERLHRLVEGLLNFGRMEAGQIRYRFEVIDPEQFVRGVVLEFERDVAGRGYRVELQGNGALPPIRADRESLARVFWNLLDNAVKYSPDARTINVDRARAGQRLAVAVRDHGIGIPAAEQKEIFQKFVRGAASKHANIQGAGVGLSMARQIVAAHGGEISLESGPGEGSVFTVLLPIAES